MRTHTALSNRSLVLNYDVFEVEEMFYKLIETHPEVVLTIDDEYIPALVIYAFEYLISGDRNILELITYYCQNQRFHKEALIEIFLKVTAANYKLFNETFDLYYNSDIHYVYIDQLYSSIRVTLTETENAKLSPVLEPDYIKSD